MLEILKKGFNRNDFYSLYYDNEKHNYIFVINDGKKHIIPSEDNLTEATDIKRIVNRKLSEKDKKSIENIFNKLGFYVIDKWEDKTILENGTEVSELGIKIKEDYSKKKELHNNLQNIVKKHHIYYDHRFNTADKTATYYFYYEDLNEDVQKKPNAEDIYKEIKQGKYNAYSISQEEPSDEEVKEVEKKSNITFKRLKDDRESYITSDDKVLIVRQDNGKFTINLYDDSQSSEIPTYKRVFLTPRYKTAGGAKKYVLDNYYKTGKFMESRNLKINEEWDDRLSELAEELTKYIRENGMTEYAYDNGNYQIQCDITWGDWKHEHLRFRYLAEEFFDKKGIDVIFDEQITEENGTDAYSASHYITIR